jgi:hypothetical protein
MQTVSFGIDSVATIVKARVCRYPAILLVILLRSEGPFLCDSSHFINTICLVHTLSTQYCLVTLYQHNMPHHTLSTQYASFTLYQHNMPRHTSSTQYASSHFINTICLVTLYQHNMPRHTLSTQYASFTANSITVTRGFPQQLLVQRAEINCRKTLIDIENRN